MSETITQSVELEVEPLKFEEYFRDNVPDEFDKLWNKRCGDCHAPCCFLQMDGYAKKPDNTEASKFWTDDFVIIKNKNDTWEDNAKDGYKIQLNPPELDPKDGLQICPLAVNGKCIIYEDRPKMCRIFTCQMKTGVYK